VSIMTGAEKRRMYAKQCGNGRASGKIGLSKDKQKGVVDEKTTEAQTGNRSGSSRAEASERVNAVGGGDPIGVKPGGEFGRLLWKGREPSPPVCPNDRADAGRESKPSIGV
jgi:hypothetical protein